MDALSLKIYSKDLVPIFIAPFRSALYSILQLLHLKRLPFLVRLSRKTRGVINQNLCFGIIFIILGVAAAAAAWLPAIYAAVLHFVGSLIVVFNSARLVRYGEELDHEHHV